MNNIVRVNHLCKNYKNVKAVEDISFSLEEGKILGIIGHNGSGKSTIVNCIASVIKPTSGSIDFLFDKRSMYKHLGLQLQESSFEPNAKVYEICKLYKELSQSDVEIDELLEEFGLDVVKGRLVSQLSGGNRQKLAILLTLIHNPELIILDELTTGLDPYARRKVWELLLDIRTKKEKTMIITSHFLDEIEYLADEIMILDKGKLIYYGTIPNAIEKYLGNEMKIRFELKDPLCRFKLDKFNPSKVSGGFYEIRTDQMESVMIELLQDVGIKNFSTSCPSLEDVFLKIAGYTLDKEGNKNVD